MFTVTDSQRADGEAASQQERETTREFACDFPAYLLAGRTVWPNFKISDAEFEAYVAARAPAGAVPSAAFAGDLLLACACVGRDEDAIGAFHAEYTPIIRRVLLRRHAAEMADDSLQLVLERLLIAPAGSAPKLAEYRGSAALRSWVATVAARTLAMMRRSSERRREEELGQDPLLAAAGADPELLYLKEHCRSELELAIVGALGRLTDRERTLLRLHLGEGMSIDQLGEMYAVNRATTARWIAAARRTLVESARAELRQKLGISASECESLMALVQSQFHLSLVRRLI